MVTKKYRLKRNFSVLFMVVFVTLAAILAGIFIVQEQKDDSYGNVEQALNQFVDANLHLFDAYLKKTDSAKLSLSEMMFIHKRYAEKINLGEFLIGRLEGDQMHLVFSRDMIGTVFDIDLIRKRGNYILADHLLKKKQGSGIYNDYSGDEVIAAYRNLGPYYLLAKVDTSVIDKTLIESKIATALILLITAIFLTLTFAILIDRHFAKSEQQFLAEEVETKLLEKERDDLEKANSAKLHFMAVLSHELRSPMTAVIGYADLVEKTQADPKKQISYLEAIRRNSRYMLDMLNSILDISKFDKGQLTVLKSATNIKEMINDVVMVCKPKAKTKEVYLGAHFYSRIPEFVYTDPSRLKQILINLINNAINYTYKGRVLLEVEYVSDPPERLDQLIFRVKDTGIGIDPDYREFLFEPFSRAEATKSIEGTGLGLAVAKELAEALGGSIKLVSTEIGKGSCFEVTTTAPVVDGSNFVEPKPEDGVAFTSTDNLIDLSP